MAVTEGARWHDNMGAQVLDTAAPGMLVLPCISLVIHKEETMPLEPFSIRADAATMEALGRIATALDRSRNWVINAALKSYVEDHAWLTEQVVASREEIARGQGIPHAQAMALLRQHIADRSA